MYGYSLHPVANSRSSALMSRKAEEVPYHLKRAEKKEELEMVLLDIDLLIVLHYRYAPIHMIMIFVKSSLKLIF